MSAVIKRKPGNPNLYKGCPPLNPTGRPGSITVLSKEVVSALRDAFAEAGGKDWLLALAKDDKRTFAQLLAKTIPSEVSATVTHTLVDLSSAMDTANARIIQLQGEAIDVTPEPQKTADSKP